MRYYKHNGADNDYIVINPKVVKFHKYHGLGNDYIVIDPKDVKFHPLSEDNVRQLCHRNFGVGSDGILLGPMEMQGNIGLLIYNPDGSEAEKSGNGLRIFSRYLFDQHYVGKEPFQIATKGGLVTSQVFDSGRAVKVEMGHVSFNSQDIPVTGEQREVLRESMTIDGEMLTYCALTVGNPHCVVLYPEATPETAHRLGPAIETDSRFPNRTNVQFLQVIDRNNIRIEIWERGAGYTLASGSSSCAAASVARRLGMCDNAITVHMPGGQLEITVSDDFNLTMTGPVTKVAEGTVCDEVFSWNG